MQSLKLLTEDNDSVWVYCKNEDLASKFLLQCEEEGFMALNGSNPTELFRHKLYGLSGDMTMGYLASMVWSLTFQDDNDDHMRIDYEKYILDEDDFICRKIDSKPNE